MIPAAPRLFCFGLGYTAARLAASVIADGWGAAGTVRDDDARGAIEAAGIEAIVFTGDRPMAATALAGATHVLSAVPPNADEQDGVDPVLACHGDDIAALEDLRWVGYLSTTGVYGDRDGGWVDEGSALTPSGERGRRRLAAEQAWLDLRRRRGVKVHLFRLAGIYGPGRSALDQVRAGTAHRIVKPGHAFSRIHVDDIVATLRASMRRPDPGAAYNVCDDRPASGAEVVAFACGLLGVEPPPEIAFAEAELSAMARSFYADNRRVRNDRIKNELGVKLQYPDYRSGLGAVLAAGG